jgi:hypothetical protein
MIGRNDPCPCGSGKKFKKCCHAKECEHQQADYLAAEEAVNQDSLLGILNLRDYTEECLRRGVCLP